jgi:prolyl-tRNA editing enzyme YbaK/EbsC (Cys-tRNA(Pro) deacylase)
VTGPAPAAWGADGAAKAEPAAAAPATTSAADAPAAPTTSRSLLRTATFSLVQPSGRLGRCHHRTPARPARYGDADPLNPVVIAAIREKYLPVGARSRAGAAGGPGPVPTLVRVSMSIGRLHAVPALERPDLLAPAVAEALAALDGKLPAEAVGVAEIDPELADTAAFCERYGVTLDESANCVVVAGRRDGETRFAACVVLATTRADVNGLVRRQLDVRKASFAATDVTVSETGMEYGGITPIGLPAHWPVFIDAAVAARPLVVIGSGVRRSKLTLPGEALGRLPGAAVLEGLAR